MKKISKYLVSILFIILTISAFGAKEDFSKNYQKDYKVNDNSSLEIINKYGNINIQDWDKQSIHIEVKVTVDQGNKADADKLLSMINVNFTENGNQIKAETQIDEGFGKSHTWFGNREGKKFSINYTVNMPKNLYLKLNNKYGNIFINNQTGLLDVDLKYGNLNINNLGRGDQKPLNQISVAYGKATFDQVNWLKFDLSYSKANFQSCKALIIVSKYSKVSIDKSSSIVAESAYDGYSLGDLSNFVITGKYSNYTVKSLSKKLSADVKYSDIIVDAIPAGFEEIQVENEYGKTNLGIGSNASYELNARVKYGSINYPDNGHISRISQNFETIVNGKVGNDKTPAKVKITSAYGGVNLMK